MSILEKSSVAMQRVERLLEPGLLPQKKAAVLTETLRNLQTSVLCSDVDGVVAGTERLLNLAHMKAKKFHPHTFCVQYSPKGLFLGYAVTNNKDRFSRSKGRQLAQARAVEATLPIDGSPIKVHQDVAATMGYVIERAKKIYQINDTVKVHAFSCEVRGETSHASRHMAKVFTA
jgi:hypothetical protein